MILKEDINFITKCVDQFVLECLHNCNFDPTVKEPGHSYSERVEEELSDKLVRNFPDKFDFPKITDKKGKQTRKMEDLIWKPTNDLINIKLGHKKGKGQPNMVSFNRLCKNYCSGIIDSYWILVIDVSGSTKKDLDTSLYFFNLYDYLDYVNYNYGTGQVMLKEKQFFLDFNSNKYFTNTKQEIVNKLKHLDTVAFRSHIKLKEEQHKKKQEMFNGCF